MRHRVPACVALYLLVAAPVSAQTEPAPADHDLLDQLGGTRTITGPVRGDSVCYGTQAEWRLGHQFLRLRTTDVNRPPQHAAPIYIGVDTSGGEAPTLGRGKRRSDCLTFRFQSPDGPFRTTFTRRLDGTGRVRTCPKSESGEWQPSATYTMRPAPLGQRTAAIAGTDAGLPAGWQRGSRRRTPPYQIYQLGLIYSPSLTCLI